MAHEVSKEAEAWLKISLIPGIGPQRLLALWSAFGSGEEALAARGEAWLQLAAIRRRFDERILRAPLMETGQLLKWIARLDLRVLVRGEPEYPEDLCDLDAPPVLLFARGDISVLKRGAVAIVGTRRASRFGARAAARLAESLAESGLLVVSGLARGIDGAAHEGALAAPSGVTAAVLAGGLDRIYPPEHRDLARRIAERGVLLSEAPPGVREDKHRFPVRNRIIAALSKAVIVAEAPQKSGALQTADLALSLGRDVYAVPADLGRWSAEGSNRLLVDTQVVIDAADVVHGTFRNDTQLKLPGLSEAAPTRRAPEAGTPQHAALDALAEGPLQLDELGAKLGISASAAASLLAHLELQGRVERLGPQLFMASGDR